MVDWDDKSEVLEAVKKDGRDLAYASEKLKADRNVVFKAVSCNGGALEFVADIHRNDKKIVLESLKGDINNMVWASDEVKKLCEGKDPIKTLEESIKQS